MSLGSYAHGIDAFVFCMIRAIEKFSNKHFQEALIKDAVKNCLKYTPLNKRILYDLPDLTKYTFDINKWNPRFARDFAYDPQNPPKILNTVTNAWDIDATVFLISVPSVPENVDSNMMKFADLMFEYKKIAQDKETLDGFEYFLIKEDCTDGIIISIVLTSNHTCVRLLVKDVENALNNADLFGDCLANNRRNGASGLPECSLEQTKKTLFSFIEDAQNLSKESYLQKVIDKYDITVVSLKEFLFEFCI